MARPKKGEGVPARQRLEQAFWQMLEESPYSEIAIASISRQAGVNHNTFYRYFGSLDDMALEMLESTLVPEMPAQVLAGFATGAFDPGKALMSKDMQDRLRKMCLLAGPHSPSWLIAKLKHKVTELWLASAGVEYDCLSDGDKAQLSFIVGGVVSAIGECGSHGDLSSLSAIAEGELGRSIVAVLASMASTRRASS